MKTIDWKIVDRMLEAQCPGTQIASYFGMHPGTFYDRVKKEKGMSLEEYAALKNNCGKNNLRLAQYKTALAGNVSMLIWLGKQHLNQKEVPSESLQFNKTLGEALNAMHKIILPGKEAEVNDIEKAA